ncbi:uncharacterized protein FOMMEDRAFT_167675 [Fomitiporia mediterranea MF3/22]|uniref:uncharacterized protein n=1 Tax=Fomitiporia mediterranea (strain MF3/22) TaxID=694068 RepID=UPI00044086DF|nr:uncharacterized protein FOMMEDRAFT_167675 [Fomitiporia mediterranea MF3/22]EJD04504.1 hypothetical protein FOMMEDRAFT_167675 [Fomitiporia mediterranea MF3/22]
MAANFNETFLESLSDADLMLMCAFNSTIDPNCLCLLSGGGPEMNTDIGGPGVRISFYLQALFLALLAARSGSLEEISGALYTLIATNVSMAITSLILGFQAQRGISLQDAIVVFYLLAGSWLAIFLSLPSYNRFVKSDTTLQVLTILHSYIVFAFIIAVLITARTFGSTPRCNPHAVGVIFSHFPALPKGRVVAIVFACCVTCVYTVLSVVDYYKVFRRRERRRVEKEKEKEKEAREEAKLKNAVAGEEVTDERDTSNPGMIVARTSQLLPPDLECGVVNLGPSISASASSSDATAASSTRGRNPGTRQRNSRRRRGAKERHYANSSTSESNHPPSEEQQQAFVTGVQGSLVIEIIVIVVLWMLFVLNTELVIKYNHFNSGEDGDGGDDVWGFGQILPMFLVLLPFVQLVKAFRKWKFGKRDHRTRKHRKPRVLHGHGHGHGHGHHHLHSHHSHPHHYQHGTGHGHRHGHTHHTPGMGFFPSAFPFFHHATGPANNPLGNQPSARISLNSVHSSSQLGQDRREDRTGSRGSLDLSVVGSPAVAGAPSINSSSSSSSSSSGDDPTGKSISSSLSSSSSSEVPTGSGSSVQEEDITYY